MRPKLHPMKRRPASDAATFATTSNHSRTKTSKLVLPIIAGMLVFSVPFHSPAFLIPSAHAAAPITYKLLKQGETTVTSGVRQLDYTWVPSDKKQSTEKVHVLQIDLTNPYVELNAMSGRGGSVTSGQSVTAMAKETHAIAGINGDIFGTTGEGAPIGAEIQSGKLQVSTSKLKGMYAFAVTKDRQPVIDNFNFEGTVTAEDGTAFNLAGINKSLYWADPNKANSHSGALYIYTNAWTAPERPTGTRATPTEALVVDDVVTEIAVDSEITTDVPANGYILRGNGTAADFITTHLPVGARVSAAYDLKSLTTGETVDPAAFQMMVSGHTILVNGGKAAAFSRDISGISGASSRSRTSVGYSQNGSTVYLVTVEENGGRNGVTLKEMQDILVRLGVWKAVSMDGGGSTTMASRPLGEFNVTLAHPTSFGTTQRQVANGIGVYTNAPAGELKGIVASGPKTVFMGQETKFSLKAYDSYYNPVDPSGLDARWDINPAVGYFKDGLLIANKAGKTTVSVHAGSASSSVGVEVVGEAAIDRLIVEPSNTVLRPGTVISAPVKARMKDGSEISVAPSAIKWEFKGFKATAADGKLTINSVEPGATTGYAIARYDGFGTAAILTPGSEKSLETFGNAGYPIDFKGLPAADTVGSASLITGVPGHESSQVLSLAYDFTNGTGSRFAYAVLNGAGGGIPVEGAPSAMTLDVLGDSSLNYLRAEFIGADGKTVMVDVARIIDWSGWKTIRVDLAAAGLKGPAKLSKLYVVNLAEGQDERALQGELAFDNLALQYPPKPFTAQKPTIVLKVGKIQATINGRTVKLPAAPFMLKDNNYLPLRFVAETMGANVAWDGGSKRVTILRGDAMLDLWVGRSEIVKNGVRQKVIAAPIMKNGSVYVPVRVVSEQLGQKVSWDGKTKTITIH